MVYEIVVLTLYPRKSSELMRSDVTSKIEEQHDTTRLNKSKRNPISNYNYASLFCTNGTENIMNDMNLVIRPGSKIKHNLILWFL